MRKKQYQHFIPGNDGELIRWAENYKLKIITIGVQLGMTPLAITEQQDALQVVIDTMNKVIAKKREQQEAVQKKKLVRKNELQVIVKNAIALKLHPLFTENMGNELGIYGPTTILSRLTIQTSLKLNVFHGVVEVTFKKRNQAGVSIFSRLKGSDAWLLLGNTTITPFRDERPLAVAGVPEIREYKALYWDGFNNIGIDSDIVSTLYGG